MVFLLICQLSIAIIFPDLKFVPDFILIFIVLKAIIVGPRQAMIYGLIGGLMQDCFLDSFIGIFTPTKTFVAFLAGFLSGRFFPENLLIPPLGVFIATIIQEMIYLFLKESYLFSANYLILVKELILPLALINSVIAFLVYSIYFFWQRWDLNG